MDITAIFLVSFGILIAVFGAVQFNGGVRRGVVRSRYVREFDRRTKPFEFWLLMAGAAGGIVFGLWLAYSMFQISLEK